LSDSSRQLSHPPAHHLQGNVLAMKNGDIGYVDFGNVAEISRMNRECLIDSVVHAMNDDYVGLGTVQGSARNSPPSLTTRAAKEKQPEKQQGKKTNRTIRARFIQGDRKRRTNRTFSRRMCSPRYGLHSYQRDWAGVANGRVRDLPPEIPNVTIRLFHRCSFLSSPVSPRRRMEHAPTAGEMPP
jgi:hypothetical protein